MAIDGKVLRRSFDSASGKSPLHMVSAWGCEQRLVLAQIATDAKSNEITAVPKLLAMLRLNGTIVTTDALNCQRAIARPIVDQGGDYVVGTERIEDDGAVVDQPSRVAIPTFSTGAASGWKGRWNQGRAVKGLHYMTGYVCCVAGPGAAILGGGGGCGGRARLRRFRRSFWSTSGSVYRLKIRVRPSMVGKWTSSI